MMMKENLLRLIRQEKGAEPADLVLKDCNRVLSLLQLEVAGLMSTCSLREVNERLDELLVATGKLGRCDDNVFMFMSFLALYPI